MHPETAWEGAEVDVAFHPNVSTDVVEVWRDDADLLWRWWFRGHDGTNLMGNRSYPSRQAAAEAAGVAYPGVLVRDRPVPPHRPTHRLRAAVLLLLAVVGVTTAGAGLLMIGAVVGTAAALRARARKRSGA